MESFKLRVGKPITPEQFDELSDEQLVRLIPKAYREFFPGKDFCADGHFYLHDGTAWSFYRGIYSMSSAPRMPNWSDADPALRARYDSFIAKVGEIDATNDIAEFHQGGLQLARDLKLEAQKLGCSRAYEFSSDIYWLAQAAATVLFFLVGSQSTAFREYLKDVLYYRNFESTSIRVKEFLAFTQCDA